MYLHLGQSVMIPYDEIIGIFDLDNASDSKWTREFLRNAEEQSVVISVCDDIPRSFVVTQNGPYDRVILSKISTHGLKSRCEGNSLGDEI